MLIFSLISVAEFAPQMADRYVMHATTIAKKNTYPLQNNLF